MELRFGLEDGRVRTLEEVGKAFGVTRERIRQIEAKTLAKLRHPNRRSRSATFSKRPEPGAARRKSHRAPVLVEDRGEIRGQIDGERVRRLLPVPPSEKDPAASRARSPASRATARALSVASSAGRVRVALPPTRQEVRSNAAAWRRADLDPSV